MRRLRHDETRTKFPDTSHISGRREFLATEASVSQARDWARDLLCLGTPSLVLDEALLLLSEVVTAPSLTPTPSYP